MATTVSYERTGLDTGTGNRSAARMAGGTFQRRPAIPEKNFQEMFQEFTNKQDEAKRVKEAAEKARNNYESGIAPPLDATGSNTIAKAEADRTLTNTAKTLEVTNKGYADRENVNLANERAKKASGLGEYKGQSDSTVTYANGAGSAWAASVMGKWDADDRAAKADLMAQKAANATQSQIDANRAVGLDNSYTQRYAAAQAAQAQKDSAALAMFGQIAGQGNYKYWGG